MSRKYLGVCMLVSASMLFGMTLASSKIEEQNEETVHSGQNTYKNRRVHSDLKKKIKN